MKDCLVDPDSDDSDGLSIGELEKLFLTLS